MASGFLSTVNYWAVLVSAVAFWLTGSLWFSALFGNAWSIEVEKHGVVIKEPTKNLLMSKMITNFVYNLITAIAVSYFVYLTGSDSTGKAVCFGLTAGIGFSFTSLGISFLWESRSLKLLLIDAGHTIIGITICFIILSLWK